MTALKVNQIGPLELKQRIDAGEALELIDVREPYEKEIADMGGKLIPLKTILDRVSEIPRDKPVIVYCRGGGRSAKAMSCRVRIHQSD
jgi:adenylyltransferase/sulfurtransferase